METKDLVYAIEDEGSTCMVKPYDWNEIDYAKVMRKMMDRGWVCPFRCEDCIHWGAEIGSPKTRDLAICSKDGKERAWDFYCRDSRERPGIMHGEPIYYHEVVYNNENEAYCKKCGKAFRDEITGPIYGCVVEGPAPVAE